MRRIQVRLSTLVVMMLTAGVLVGANARTKTFTVPVHNRFACEIQGWPWVFSYELKKLPEKPKAPPDEKPQEEQSDPFWPPPGASKIDLGIMPQAPLPSSLQSSTDETVQKLEEILRQMQDQIDESECRTILAMLYPNLQMNAALDLAAALGLVALAGAAMEFLLRRRAKVEPILPNTGMSPESSA